MKNVIFVCGTMGVGKTSACRELQAVLERNVFLDGDWCWDARPFVVDEYTRRMVVDNICHLLNGFIACPHYDNVIFCWVMHQQSIIDDIAGRLKGEFRLHKFALVCSPGELERRIMGDVKRGVRTPDVLERSLPRLPLYGALDAQPMDVTRLTARETALEIARRISSGT
ncbi:MAG: AAA family ATPase [Candidatus Fimadaptatus sp.]